MFNWKWPVLLLFDLQYLRLFFIKLFNQRYFWGGADFKTVPRFEIWPIFAHKSSKLRCNTGTLLLTLHDLRYLLVDSKGNFVSSNETLIHKTHKMDNPNLVKNSVQSQKWLNKTKSLKSHERWWFQAVRGFEDGRTFVKVESFLRLKI